MEDELGNTNLAPPRVDSKNDLNDISTSNHVSVHPGKEMPAISKDFSSQDPGAQTAETKVKSPEERQYGTWDSPITMDLLCQSSIGLDSPRAHGKSIYYLEAHNDGRNTIIQLIDGCSDKRVEILPKQHSVGTRVHEYGGGAFAVHRPSGNLLFSDARNDGLYFLRPGDMGKATWTADCIVQQPGQRFADFDSHPSSGMVICVRETHDVNNDVAATVRNEIVLIDLFTKSIDPLVSGTADFYSHPTFSPDGSKISWLQWSHPEMPWTGSQLYCAGFYSSSAIGANLSNTIHVAGSGKLNGIGQPRWGVDGTLFFADDKSGYWQLYQYFKGKHESDLVKINGLEDTDLATAESKLGSCTYLPMDENKLIVVSIRQAIHSIFEVDLRTGVCRDLGIPVVDAAYDALYKISSTEFLVIGASAVKPQALFKIDIAGPTPQITLLRASSNIQLDPTRLSVPKAMSCDRLHGTFQEGKIHGFYMPPCNPDFVAPVGTLPALIVFAHGGPTGHYKASLQLDVQYWTSRGYAVYLLNYAGSTGYGCSYRRLLDGNWGLLDAADAASAATYLSQQGLVDASRLGIQGPSAGGYITLKTICDQPCVWAGAISLFGVSELQSFTEGTHKFESHYMDRLLHGDDMNPSQDRREAVRIERSPVCHAESIRTPLMMLQGDKDTVVPPQQAEAMMKVLQRGGQTAELIMFEGERHCVWRGDALRRSMEAQERWWKRYLLRID